MFRACKELCPELAVIDESLFTGFGGGFAGMGRVCGAVTSATAVVSYLKRDTNNPTERTKAYDSLRSLYKDFEAEYGSLDCSDITGCDFTNPAEQQKFRDENKRVTICTPLVRYVVEQIYSLK